MRVMGHHEALAALSAALIMATAGCVTINIYFPAAAAEQAADRIIDKVWELKPGEAPKAGNAPPAPAAKEAQ
jgi:hypothetical protein